MEREKIRVAGDDVSGLAAHGEFEEFVVFRVTASSYPYIDIDPLSLARQCGEKTVDVFLVSIPAELFPAQNLIEFDECCEGKQNLSFSEDQIEGLARLGIGQEQRTNEDIGIEDAAQTRRPSEGNPKPPV